MISQAMEKELLSQLNAEFYSAYLYLAMSAYCSKIEFNGAARWLKLQYDEEIGHATKIYNYLVDQGVHVVLDAIKQPPSEFGTVLDVFTSSLEHEQKMSELLNVLSDWLKQEMFEVHLKLRLSDGRSIAFCHEHGAVLSKTANDEVMDIVVRLNPADAGRFIEQSGIHSLL